MRSLTAFLFGLFNIFIIASDIYRGFIYLFMLYCSIHFGFVPICISSILNYNNLLCHQASHVIQFERQLSDVFGFCTDSWRSCASSHLQTIFGNQVLHSMFVTATLKVHFALPPFPNTIFKTCKDNVAVAPSQFSAPAHVAITNELNKKYANRVLLDVGLCICVFDLIWVGEGVVKYGDGCYWYKGV
jgi:hypothetical protein